MITLEEYFGKFRSEATPEHVANAIALLRSVSALHDALVTMGVTLPYNPKTNSLISGSQFGGYRPQDCCEGAPQSAHKQGLAVDLYDPNGEIDLTLYNHQDLLIQYGIYIEHPEKTPNWSHWSIKPPKSGKHVFYP